MEASKTPQKYSSSFKVRPSQKKIGDVIFVVYYERKVPEPKAIDNQPIEIHYVDERREINQLLLGVVPAARDDRAFVRSLGDGYRKKSNTSQRRPKTRPKRAKQ